MKINTIFWTIIGTVVATQCIAADPPSLFREVTIKSATISGHAPRISSRNIFDAWEIVPDTSLLHALAAGTLGASSPEVLLQLAPDLNVRAQPYRVEKSPNGAVSVSLRIAGYPFSVAVLTEFGGNVYGIISLPGAPYIVKPLSDGTHIMQRLSPSTFAFEHSPREAAGAAPRSNDAAGAADVPSDTGRLIDVMIVWDDAAQTAIGGGAPAMQLLASNSVAVANTAYANSGIAQRLRLVYSGKVTYAQRNGGSNCTDAFDCALDDVTNDLITVPGKLSTLRDANGADLVTMLISDSTSCGIAWLPDTISSANSGYGFSVVDAQCAVGNFSYPHELGHNMGANHDVAHSGPGGPKPYNHGFYSATNCWRTVMAYPDNCPTNVVDTSGTRIAWFSNPDYMVDFDGPGGKPPVTMGTTGIENNAMVLNLAAKSVGAYRATSASHPISASFTDVPVGNSQFGAVEFLHQAQITAGCAANTYCPDQLITRRQMAVFLERDRKNSLYVPASATGVFADVPPNSQFANFIEALASDGITLGCSPGRFCPDDPVSRAQMSIFILRSSCGAAYTPSAATGTLFADVGPEAAGAAYIEKLYRMGVTTGCATNPLRFCPDVSLTRGQMAVFLERAYPFLSPSEVCTP